MSRILLWISAWLLCGTLCAMSAMAEVRHADAYEKLTAVPQAPFENRYLDGMASLSSHERSHGEKLPVQLSAAMKKVHKARYQSKKRLPAPKKAKRS